MNRGICFPDTPEAQTSPRHGSVHADDGRKMGIMKCTGTEKYSSISAVASSKQLSVDLLLCKLLTVHSTHDSLTLPLKCPNYSSQMSIFNLNSNSSLYSPYLWQWPYCVLVFHLNQDWSACCREWACIIRGRGSVKSAPPVFTLKSKRKDPPISSSQ